MYAICVNESDMCIDDVLSSMLIFSMLITNPNRSFLRENFSASNNW